ncbi:MAG: D-glucuronyl C5-epimerase family protein, partial [bacterium]
MTLVVAALFLAALAVALRWLREAAVLRRKHSVSKVVWSDFRAETLGPYYFPNSVDPGPFAQLDERGVRVIDFSKKPTIGKTGRQYVISAIDQYGLGSWDLWLAAKEPARLDAVRRQADWLVENQTVDGDGTGAWLHGYPVGGEHQVEPPWISGLAQGMSISLLLRAWQATGHEPYREASARALRSFVAPVGRGGVRALDEAGRT